MSVRMKGASHCPLLAIKMESPIPITIALSYDTYASLFSQGLLDSYLCETTCPKYPHDCSSQDPPTALELTNSTVSRTAFILEKDEYGIDTVVERTVKIALGRCPICKCRYRVLPADILPYKLYSLPVIELAVSLYNGGDLSLRQVAWDQLYGERTPEHTTLHGWTEGLGAYWLGRTVGEVAFSVPATRILAELELRFSQMRSLHSIPVWINPKRYRSQGRLERLEACKRLEIIGTMLDVKNPLKFVELNRLIVGWGNSCGLGFRTGICCTAIEHIDSTDVRSWLQIPTKEQLSCPIRGRSPPGDSK
ncbi:MAG: hypothetical protein JRH18_24480 [Deltaproteobacteria bacterium]|nr:hypothetical protein [Deltaproteobacteria bacterium]